MKLQTPARLGLYLLMAPLLLWLVVLIFLPHVDMFLLSISEKVATRTYQTSAANYMEFFSEPLYWRTFARTAIMSIAATALTFVIAFPVSYYIAKMLRGRLKAFLFLLCLVPFWVSELVRTFGWMILLRESGIFSNLLQWSGLASGPVEMLYNDATIMVGLVYTSLLFMVVPLVSTLDSLDDAPGGGRVRSWRQRLYRHEGNHHPSCHAGNRFGLHHRLHVDAGKLPDPGFVGRQG